MDIFKTWLVTQPIAHRGFHDDTHPENSLSAFQNAIDHGYAIELDVRPIADGTPVVFHDDKLSRMTNADGYVSKIKDVNELKKLTLLNSKETIPTMREMLEFVDGKAPLLIEIKNENINSTFEKEVYEELKNYKGKYAIQSFNPYTLKWFKLNAPDIPRGQLASLFKDEKMDFFRKFVLKRMMLNKSVSEPDFLAYKYDDLPNRFVNKYKNLPLLVWAVPSQQEYKKVMPHCDNIIFENFEPKI